MHLDLDVVGLTHNTSYWEAEAVGSKLVLATELLFKQKQDKTPT